MGGKSSWSMLNTFLALGVNIGLNAVLIPRYGITGAAISWAAAIIIENLACVVEVHILLGLDTFNRATIETGVAAALAFGATGLVTIAVAGQTISSMICWAIISLAVYGTWAWRRRRALNFTELVGLLRPHRSTVDVLVPS
jgi:O-antigen/teichoic acid export membrane protein